MSCTYLNATFTDVSAHVVLQDYQARAGIRELNGIAPILELTQSEYPVIQELALVALERVTQDAENR